MSSRPGVRLLGGDGKRVADSRRPRIQGRGNPACTPGRGRGKKITQRVIKKAAFQRPSTLRSGEFVFHLLAHRSYLGKQNFFYVTKGADPVFFCNLLKHCGYHGCGHEFFHRRGDSFSSPYLKVTLFLNPQSSISLNAVQMALIFLRVFAPANRANNEVCSPFTELESVSAF